MQYYTYIYSTYSGSHNDNHLSVCDELPSDAQKGHPRLPTHEKKTHTNATNADLCNTHHHSQYHYKKKTKSDITRTRSFALIQQQMRLEEAIINLPKSVCGIVADLAEQLFHGTCRSGDSAGPFCRSYA